jgi:hypothetical protein
VGEQLRDELGMARHDQALVELEAWEHLAEASCANHVHEPLQEPLTELGLELPERERVRRDRAGVVALCAGRGKAGE